MARLDDYERGLVDAHGVSVKAELDERGRELGDPLPVAPPAHLRRGQTTAEMIQSMVRRELSLRAEEHGFETFEESDDFDIDDDPADPHTSYEAHFDPLPPLKETDNGKSGSDEGGRTTADGGSGKSGEVREGEPGAKRPAPDKGSPSKAAAGDPSPKGQD